MCVNIFLKQRCIAFSVGECNVGGNSTLKSRVLTDRAGSGFVKSASMFLESRTRGEQNPQR